MKADRLLSALMLLQANGRLSTRELAARLEVSHRTAHRDMEALCFAGIPLLSFRGAGGGWELQKGWRTKVPGLDEAELRALLMAQPSLLGDPHLVAAAERAFGKLMAAMPEPMQTRAAKVRARVHIDPAGWWPSPDGHSQLSLLQEAVALDQRITFSYTPPGGDTAARTVDPLGLVCKQAVWYLVARTPKGMRTYRVSRISEVAMLASSFSRPAKFDLAAHWKASTLELERQRPQYLVSLALSPEAAVSMQRWFHTSPAETGLNSNLPPGWRVFEVEFETESQAAFVVLGHGARAKVLAPPELAARVRDEVETLVSQRHAPVVNEN